MYIYIIFLEKFYVHCSRINYYPPIYFLLSTFLQCAFGKRNTIKTFPSNNVDIETQGA